MNTTAIEIAKKGLVNSEEIPKINKVRLSSDKVPLRKSDFLAGTCIVTITPPDGAPIVDNQYQSVGVHDDLFARVLVLSDAKHKVAIVCLDLELFDVSWSDKVREIVRSQTGIAVTLLNSTHTHSAPCFMPWNKYREEWFKEGRGLLWREGLAVKVSDAVSQAVSNLIEAKLRVGRASVQVGTNRRLPTDKGIVMKPNPNGAVVPWVDVLRVDDIRGNPIAILFSHAAHPVILHSASMLISADYPGYAVKEVEKYFDGRVMAMFAQGCCGDINGDPLQGGFEAARKAGEMLGEAVVKAAIGSEIIHSTELRTTFKIVDLPFQEMKEPIRYKIALSEAKERQAKSGGKGKALEQVEILSDLLTRSEGSREQQTLRFEIQKIAFGKEWCLLAMPHEIFAEYQLWIDKNSPYAHNMVLAYTGGCESYVPTDNDFELGGYEAVSPPAQGAALFYRYHAALRPGIEQQIKTAIYRLMMH